MKTNDIARAVGKYLEKSGRNVSYLPYTDVVQECYAWYKNDTEWHNYFIYNGLRNVHLTRAKLGMAKMACEDWASLLFNERVKITASGDPEHDIITLTLKDNKFTVEANKLVELMFALGTGAFVETWNNGRVTIDYIHGDLIFPLSWDNGVVTECAFAVIGGGLENAAYTLILHEIDETGCYVIKTVEIDSEGDICKPVRPIEIVQGIQTTEETNGQYTKIMYTGSSVPCFQIIKPNIVNNYDKTSPFGMNIIYNAIDILKSIDVEYDSLLNEFKLGKKRIFVKNGLKSIKVVDSKDKKNKVVNHIDPNDTEFYTINTDDDNGKLPIQIFDPTLRTSEHNTALNTQLNLFARAVGLGDGFYEFTGSNTARTATEIVSINSALFRNLNKHELIMTSAIEGLCKAILNLYNIYGGKKYNIGTEITIDYDDSIIDDSEKTQQKAMAEYNAGLIDQVEYFALTRNMTREQAQKFVSEMKATDTMKQVETLMNFDNGGF